MKPRRPDSRLRQAHLREARTRKRIEAQHKRLQRVHDELAVAHLNLTDEQRPRVEALLKRRGALAHASIARELGLTHSFVHSLARKIVREAGAQ
jgi:hypothetical protein